MPTIGIKLVKTDRNSEEENENLSPSAYVDRLFHMVDGTRTGAKRSEERRVG